MMNSTARFPTERDLLVSLVDRGMIAIGMEFNRIQSVGRRGEPRAVYSDAPRTAPEASRATKLLLSPCARYGVVHDATTVPVTCSLSAGWS